MRISNLFSVLLFTGILPLTTVAQSSGLDWASQEYTTAPGELGVPTTQWGAPKYAQGRISVLVFKNEGVNDLNMRQVMELGQAFDLDLKHVMTSHGNANYADNARALKLLSERRWDLFVFWGTAPGRNNYTYLSDEVRARIQLQVADGAGMLLLENGCPVPPELGLKERMVAVSTNALMGGMALTGRASRDEKYNPGFWKDCFGPAKVLSEDELRARSYSLYTIGKGRLLSRGAGFFVKINSGDTEALQWSPTHRSDSDYMMAEVGRALWVASGKAPQVGFVAMPPAIWKLNWETPPGSRSVWVFDVAGQARTLTVAWRIRDLTGREVALDSRQFPKASGRIECPVTLPALGAGRYYLDVFVDGPQGRENYGYSAIDVASPLLVTLALEKRSIQPGVPVKGTVTVTTNGELRQSVESVLLKLIDNEDRVIDQKVVAASAGKPVAFSLDSVGSESLELGIVAEALCGGRLAGATSQSVNVLNRGLDRYNVVLWGSTGDGPYNYWYNRQLRRTGVTSVTCVEQPGKAPYQNPGTRANLTRTPFIAAWDTWSGEIDGKKVSFSATPKPDINGVLSMAPFSWNDQPNFEKMLALQDRHWKRGLESATFLYNLYDEGPHAGCDLTPASLAAYREWLKEQYKGSLAALNLEWQSQYVSWDEVNVLEKNDNMEAQALAQKLYARWSDRHHFNYANFGRTVLQGLTRHARAIDPQARIGFEGSGEFGMDLDEVLAPDAAGFWSPYDGIQTDMIRSLKSPGFIYGFWIGYDKEADQLISKAWRMVTHGAPSLWWWMMKGCGQFHGWLAPNCIPYPENQKLLDECILPMRRGLGDLLLKMDMPHSGVAIYYSIAAANVGGLARNEALAASANHSAKGFMAEAAAFNSIQGAHEAISRLIEDCGFQWVYTTKQRVLEGDLEQRKIKLLILPFHQTLGEDEVAALTTFVAAGGTVLADLRPGVCSAHGRPLEHGPADKLFGIERTGPGKAEPLEGDIRVAFAAKEIPVSLYNNRGDSQIKATTATAGGTIAGKPVFLVNSIGKGQAMLLNFHLTQYGSQREMKRGSQQREFFLALVQALGLQPKLQRFDGQGVPLSYTETAVWQKGGVTLYSLLKDAGNESAAEIILPEKRYVFSLRTGPQNETDRYNIALLQPGHADFFAAYPYDPGRPVIHADKTAVTGGDLVNVAITMSGVPADERGPFSYHTQLFDPQGNWVDVTPWSVQGTGGKARLQIRFAHNDAPGTWKLVVREVTTGRAAEGRFEMKQTKVNE